MSLIFVQFDKYISFFILLALVVFVISVLKSVAEQLLEDVHACSVNHNTSEYMKGMIHIEAVCI